MVKIYKQPFAHDGDAIAIPDASQLDGKMSNVDGWTPDYQLPKTDPNYKPVGRQEMNGVFREVTEALGQVQVQGAASWSLDGAPYPVSAQTYHNGKQWLALRANSVAPTEGEDWSAIGTASQLATKADKTTEVIAGTGLTGGGSLAANRTLNVSYGTAAGTAAQGNDSRIVNAVPKSREISAGTGLTGGGNLSSDRTLSLASSHTPIGVDQTWRNMTASRVLGTTYTNTTGRTIVIMLSTGGNNKSFFVNGVDFNLWNETGTATFIIPPGNTYRTDNNFDKFMELR